MSRYLSVVARKLDSTAAGKAETSAAQATNFCAFSTAKLSRRRGSKKPSEIKGSRMWW